MPEATPPRLQVVSREGCHYIVVPPVWAGDLRTYLRAKGFSSSPPEPSSTGFVSVTLTGKADAEIVQSVLDRWEIHV